MSAGPFPAAQAGAGGMARAEFGALGVVGVGVCTTSEAARMLGVSNTTVQTLVERGVLQAWKTRGGHRRISRDSVDALRASREAGAIPEGSPSPGLMMLVVEPDDRARIRFGSAVAAWRLPVRLLWARDAIDAVIALERHRPDLLVTDLRATPIDGFALLRRLRGVPEYRSTAFVVITALDEGDIAAHGGLPVATVRYGLPVPWDTLRGYVQACLAGKGMNPSEHPSAQSYSNE